MAKELQKTKADQKADQNDEKENVKPEDLEIKNKIKKVIIKRLIIGFLGLIVLILILILIHKISNSLISTWKENDEEKEFFKMKEIKKEQESSFKNFIGKGSVSSNFVIPNVLDEYLYLNWEPLISKEKNYKWNYPLIRSLGLKSPTIKTVYDLTKKNKADFKDLVNTINKDVLSKK